MQYATPSWGKLVLYYTTLYVLMNLLLLHKVEYVTQTEN